MYHNDILIKLPSITSSVLIISFTPIGGSIKNNLNYLYFRKKINKKPKNKIT